MTHTAATRPQWTFAAVCVMVVSMALLLFGLSQVPSLQLLPGYVAAYLLIGACIFGPAGKLSLRQAVAFLLPGALLVVLALLNMGFWAGGWLLGLPAWGLLLTRWTSENPPRVRHLPPHRAEGQVDAEHVRSSPCSGRGCCARLPAWMTREAVSCRSSAKANTYYGLVVLIRGFTSPARTPF
ncbi:hypothetical protein [Pseudarthrobacter sp. NPDC058119]|uniref:hypothetical protein n=1 Tax=Pseudarthrobacter sp. NPDC058119 TaxID=3346348 RepID=UPI0036DBE893